MKCFLNFYGYDYFFNGEYAFILQKSWIINGWNNGSKFTVNYFENEKIKEEFLLLLGIKNLVLNHKRISKREINKQIKLVRKHFPELMI